MTLWPMLNSMAGAAVGAEARNDPIVEWRAHEVGAWVLSHQIATMRSFVGGFGLWEYGDAETPAHMRIFGAPVVIDNHVAKRRLIATTKHGEIIGG